RSKNTRRVEGAGQKKELRADCLQTMGCVIIGADHAGFVLKEGLKKVLAEKGLQVIDAGTDNGEAVDYPDFAEAVAEEVSAGRVPWGVLVCGSGVGMSIVANRFPGVRAALCLDEDTARMSRRHNDANVLVLAGRKTDLNTAEKIVTVWLETGFEGGRHQARLDKVVQVEKRIITRAGKGIPFGTRDSMDRCGIRKA
ncbi:MAG TPA: ribose 5-phosphate isomerase B, partial [Syntrophales bacterium]|nr:ribose 5-phosphate isomerase B [Syntrophales bacterium]